MTEWHQTRQSLIDTEPLSETNLPVEVVRSARRRRTAQARVTQGQIKVMIPAGLPRKQETELIDDLVAKAKRKLTSEHINLMERCRELSRRYDLPLPTEVTWSERQQGRWGSCTRSTGKTRISTRLVSVPGWVLDSVLIHEMAHLAEANHGVAFRDLVGRYHLMERAHGYLMAMEQMQVT